MSYPQCPDNSVYEDRHFVGVHDIETAGCPTCLEYKRRVDERFGTSYDYLGYIKILWDEDHTAVDPGELKRAQDSLQSLREELAKENNEGVASTA